MAELSRASSKLGGAAHVDATLASDVRRLRLVGSPAPAISAPRWLNASTRDRVHRIGDGRVTLVQFTAEWCAPCRASSPTMRALRQSLSPDSFDIVFVTSLMGALGARKEQGIRCPVAVYPSTAAYDSTAGAYAASGFPELVLVDKHGIIRRVTAGWGAISVAPLDSAIQALIRAR